jgi:hypothetical protein
MNALDMLRESAAQTTMLANKLMANTDSQEVFAEAFRTRDIAFVEGQGFDEEQLAELRYETMCGCNGNDSPYHTYFGIGDPMEDVEYEDRFRGDDSWSGYEDDFYGSLDSVKTRWPHLYDEFKFCIEVLDCPEEYPHLDIKKYLERARQIDKEVFAWANGLPMQGL